MALAHLPPSEKPVSLGELFEHLGLSLYSLFTSSKWAIFTATTPPFLRSKTPRVNEAHRLGPVNLSDAKCDFVDRLSQIRTTIQTYVDKLSHAGELHSSASAAKRYITLSKEESTLSNNICKARQSLQDCGELLREVCALGKGTVTTNYLENSVRTFARESGFEEYTETSVKGGVQLTTVTLVGSIIVVDIEVESSSIIRKVEVAYASGSGQDERKSFPFGKVDKLLSQNLRQNALLAFRQNLHGLALLDGLNKEYSTSQIDFFRVIYCIQNDLQFIYQTEIQFFGNDLEKALLQGHGLPFLHFKRPGPSIAFYAPKEARSRMDWTILRRLCEYDVSVTIDRNEHNDDELMNAMFRLWINLERTAESMPFPRGSKFDSYIVREGSSPHEEKITTHEFVPEHDSVACISGGTPKSPKFRYIQPKILTGPSTEGNRVKAHFVATLEPALLVSEWTALQLEYLCPESSTGGVQRFGDNSDTMMLEEAMAFEAIEQYYTKDADRQAPISAKATLEMSHIWKLNVETNGTPEAQPTILSFSFAGRQHACRRIHRVPFHSPSQLRFITQILRRECMFAALFKSCFNATTYIPLQKPLLSAILSLDEFLNNAQEDTHFSVELKIGIGVSDSRPVVYVCDWSDSSKIMVDQELTEVLRREESIPMLVRQVTQNLPEQLEKVTSMDEDKEKEDMIRATDFEIVTTPRRKQPSRKRVKR